MGNTLSSNYANSPEIVTLTDPLIGAVPTLSAISPAETYSPKAVGPKYPAHSTDAPIISGLDGPGLIAAAVITLGPLAAYAFGFGA